MAEPTSIVPDKGIRPGYNETGVTIAKNLFVVETAGSAPDSIALGAAGARTKGVTMEEILDEERGDVQTEGQAIVTAGAAITRGAEVATLATGKARVAITGDIVAGVARSAAAADGDLFEVELKDGSHVVP